MKISRKITIKAWAVVSENVIDKSWNDVDTSFYAIFPKKHMANRYAIVNEFQDVIPVTLTYISSKKNKHEKRS